MCVVVAEAVAAEEDVVAVVAVGTTLEGVADTLEALGDDVVGKFWELVDINVDDVIRDEEELIPMFRVMKATTLEKINKWRFNEVQ